MNTDLPINHENIKIVQVAKDTTGKHMKLEVTLPDGRTIIRWGLDEVDYKKIRNIVSKNHFDSLETGYHYELLPYIGVSIEKPNGEQKFIGNVRCVQGQKAAKIEFECSKRFAGNMEWFRRDVKCLGDLSHLKWEEFEV